MTVFFGIFSTLNLVSRYFCCQLNARHMPNWNAKRILEHVIDIIQCLVSTVPHNHALLMSAHEICNIGSDKGILGDRNTLGAVTNHSDGSFIHRCCLFSLHTPLCSRQSEITFTLQLKFSCIVEILE